jgi:hypothetical protein
MVSQLNYLFIALVWILLPHVVLAQPPVQRPGEHTQLELPPDLVEEVPENGVVQPVTEADNSAEQAEARLSTLLATTPLGGAPPETRVTPPSGSAADLRKGIDYQYEAAIRQALQATQSQAEPAEATPGFVRFLLDILEDLFSIFPSIDRPAEWGYWFLWGIVVLAAIFILLRLLKIDLWELLTGRARNTAIAFEEAEENIHELDLQALQAQALAERDYRRAIRYAFLTILKDLDDRKQIHWEPRKTNNEYLAELKPRTQLAFRPLARQYERAWFSLHPIDEHSWESTQELVREVRKSL